jgi:DnaJ like chaperone protein
MKRNRGKLFGAALGFSFGGPIGALLGAAIGHLVDETSDSTAGPGAFTGAGSGELNFITSLIYLLVGAARADGAVTDREIETIKSFFKNQLGYSSTQLYFVNRIISAAMDRNINMGDACRDISSRTVYEERLFLIRLCYEVALSDRNINPSEEEFIARAAQNFGINDYDYMMVRRSFVHSQRADLDESSSLQNPYAVLGIDPGSSAEEIQRAYRELASKYHPDKVSHLGHEFIDLATRKFTAIQAAYERIKEERGLA